MFYPHLNYKDAFVPKPKLVIFDCDGVLVDSEIAHAEVLSKNFRDYGLDLTADACLEQFTGIKMAVIGQTATKLGASLPENWTDEIYGKIFARLRLGVPVIDGAPEIITRLENAGVPFCVASNGSEEKMKITLSPSGLRERFREVIFSAHTVGIWKPDPGLFLHAANSFNIAPADCVVIEDSLTGVVAAKRAGMHCLGYAPNGDGARLANEGATPFNSMHALAKLLHLDES